MTLIPSGCEVYSGILTGNWGANRQTISNIDQNQINNYFANVAIDHDYDRCAVIKAALQAPHRAADFVKYTRASIELILTRIRTTSPGNDIIPYLVYRDCAHELSEVVTMLVNLSIGLSVVPCALRIAVITPGT